MRFHGLMIIRDEGDIIAETLTHLLTWIDVLHIYDLGSTDDTWDIVQNFAKRDSRVKPFKNEPTVFQESLRCVMFDRLRSGFKKGDWIVKLDGDEFYPVPPPQFVNERLRPVEGMVYLQWYFFRLTTEEAAAYESGVVSIAKDRERSIHDRRRYYKVSQFSEPRLFRYRPAMRWPRTTNWPYNAGLLAYERIPVLHYPHRDPVQLTRRFALRAAMKQRKADASSHWDTADWRGELVDPVTSIALGAKMEKPEGLAGEKGIDTGPLLYWEPNTPLQEVHLHHQIAPPLKRLAQCITYAALLPILDSRRPCYNSDYVPELISAEDNERIGAACAGAAISVF